MDEAAAFSVIVCNGTIPKALNTLVRDQVPAHIELEGA
jgi:hypothetical protein